MEKMTKRSNDKVNQQGITLVALVVTIIVLLILAGVTISLVLGQAGIFSKAGEAKTKTTESQAIEKVKLAVLELKTEKNGSTQGITLEAIAQRVEGGTALAPKEIPGIILVDGVRVKVDENLGVSIDGKAEEGGQEIELPSTAETTPYAPKGSTVIEGTNLDNGLVIKDKNNNEWVWVEVPKSITASSNTDAQIETALQTYAVDYRKTGYTDTWYRAFGLTEEQYYSNKSKMLQSIKANGGFWIGRYEVGSDIQRTGSSDPLTVPYIQQDKYPYNWVDVESSQGLASQLAPNSTCTTSLLYGIQWDLTCKYMEEKGSLEDGSKLKEVDINDDSTKWGNYNNATFHITRGKYSDDFGSTFINVVQTYTKPSSTVYLTTGASERNKVLNIYDLAGNTSGWTLENSGMDSGMCVSRGGYCGSEGRKNPCAYREASATSYSNTYTPRATLYK